MMLLEKVSGRLTREKHLLILLFLMPFLLRLAFVFYVEVFMFPGTYLKLGDESDYHYRTVALVRGAGVNISTDKLGYYAFLAPIYFIFGPHRIVAIIIQCILGAAACILIYQVVRTVFSTKVGMIAWLLCSLYPTLIWWCGFLVKESLLVFLLAMMLYTGMKAGRSGSGTGVILWTLCLFFAGFYTGLTRLTSFAFFPVMILWIILSPKGVKGKIYCLLIVAVLSSLFLLSFKMPFAPFNRLEYSKITPAPLINRWVESFSNPSEQFAVEQFGFSGFYRLWRPRPWSFLKRVPLVWRAFPDKTNRDLPAVATGLLYLFLLPFAAYGFVCALTWKPRDAIFLFLILFVFTAIHLFTLQRLRFRVQVMPVFLIFASTGLVDTWDYLIGLIRKRVRKGS